MKKLSVIMFFVSVIMYGCTEKRVLGSELKYVPGEKSPRYGTWYYQGEPFTGVAFSMYSNSKLMMEATYKDGKKDGVLKYYHYSGSLVAEETYKDGLSHGLWTKYDISGRIRSQKTYENGEVVEIHIEK